MNYISIAKNVLQEAGWYIQKSADLFDKTEHLKYHPYVVGFCPVCDAQHILQYVKQSDVAFIFYCLYCWEVDHRMRNREVS